MAPQPSVLIDTNIILEATRIGVFQQLRARGGLVTVKRCCEEALSGKTGERGRIIVAPDELSDPLSVVEVSQAGRVHVALLHPESSVLDDGERDLLVHAFEIDRNNNPGAMGAAFARAGHSVSNATREFSIVTADQAAVRVAMLMGFGDRLLSLEEVLRSVALKESQSLKSHYTRATLSSWKTRHKLGM